MQRDSGLSWRVLPSSRGRESGVGLERQRKRYTLPGPRAPVIHFLWYCIVGYKVIRFKVTKGWEAERRKGRRGERERMWKEGEREDRERNALFPSNQEDRLDRLLVVGSESISPSLEGRHHSSQCHSSLSSCHQLPGETEGMSEAPE